MRRFISITLAVGLAVAAAFTIPSPSMIVFESPRLSQRTSGTRSSTLFRPHPKVFSILWSEPDENTDVASTVEDSFDGKGFAKYLAPYMLTAIAGVLVTGLFVKFVLMDY